MYDRDEELFNLFHDKPELNNEFNDAMTLVEPLAMAARVRKRRNRAMGAKHERVENAKLKKSKKRLDVIKPV